MPGERFPKIVARFRFTGNRATLRTQADTAAASIRTRAALVATAVIGSTDVIEFAGRLWEFYPKIICPDREFAQAEEPTLNLYIDDVTTTIQTTLVGVGATEISIIAQRRG
jgi:hypothetical protein